MLVPEDRVARLGSRIDAVEDPRLGFQVEAGVGEVLVPVRVLDDDFDLRVAALAGPTIRLCAASFIRSRRNSLQLLVPFALMSLSVFVVVKKKSSRISSSKRPAVNRTTSSMCFRSAGSV
jgi:hypothetical protein